MEKKKIIELISSIFVAVIFLTSYAAFGNVVGAPRTTTTTANTQTLYASVQGAANVISFGPALSISISCLNTTSVSSKINAILVSLQENGSVGSFYSQEAAQVLVEAGNMSSYNIYSLLARGIDDNVSCTGFSSSANIELPASMNFYVHPQDSYQGGYINLTIPESLRRASVPAQFIQNMSKSVNVSVAVLLTTNGSIYGNLSVKKI